MLNLEQIRLLESRVQKAIQYIQKLREENKSLRASLETYEKRIGDLEGMVGDFRSGQQEIEVSITNALKQLDRLEDALIEEPDETGAPRKAAPSNPSSGGLHARAEQKDRTSGRAGAAASAETSIRTEHGKPDRESPAARRTEKPQSDDDFEATPIDRGGKTEDETVPGDASSDKESADSELDIF